MIYFVTMLLMLCVIYYFINDSSIISLLLCLLFNTFLFDVYILGYNSKDMISLYNGDKEIKIEVKDESYSYEAIMGEDTLTLYFSHPGYIEIPVGSWCDFYGKRYSLKKDSNFKKNGERNFEYTLILETGKADAMLWKVRHTVDRSIKFSYTAKAHEHLRLLVENLNRRSTGWKVGDCIEGTEKVINYNHTYILDAFNQLAELYETEWQITEETVEGKQIKTIHLRKVEYNKENPLKLSYGKTGRCSLASRCQRLFSLPIRRILLSISFPVRWLCNVLTKQLEAVVNGMRQLLLRTRVDIAML